MTLPATALPPQSAEQPSALDAVGLTRRYGGATALADVSLQVAAGSVVALVGGNGAGKSSLLGLVLGHAPPDGGALQVLGTDPWRRPVAGLAGWVGAPRLPPSMRVRDALVMVLDYEGGGSRAEPLLERVGLREAAARRVAALSTGQRQRLGLAVALARRPRLLVLDEPQTGLDPAGQAMLDTLLRTLADDGCAVLLSSHDLTAVEADCDRVVVLSRGRVVADATPGELRASAPAVVHRLATSDDEQARRLARQAPAVELVAGSADAPLLVRGATAALDAYVLRLGAAGIAVRSLQQERSSLAELLRQLTGPAT